MPVLIEAISVVIRREAIRKKFPGGLPAFELAAPTMGPVDTLCADDDLVRVGFMMPIDVKHFCDDLRRYGIGSPEDPVDLAVIDQLTSAVTPCDWVETQGVNLEGGGRVLIARMVGSTDEVLVVPENWTFESSITKTCFFTPTTAFEGTMEYMGTEGPLDVWRDKLTGESRFVGKPTAPTIARSQRVQAWHGRALPLAVSRHLRLFDKRS